MNVVKGMRVDIISMGWTLSEIFCKCKFSVMDRVLGVFQQPVSLHNTSHNHQITKMQ